MITAEKVCSYLNNPLIQNRLEKLAKRDKSGRALMDKAVCGYIGQEKEKRRTSYTINFSTQYRKKRNRKKTSSPEY